MSSEPCPQCGFEGVVERTQAETFQYGDGGAQAAQIRVELIVLACPMCEFAWTDERAEVVRDEAIRAHLHMSLRVARAMADEALVVIRDLVYQFGYYANGAFLTGGLSALEGAFDLLGWQDPHPAPEAGCDEPGCGERATCGSPTPTLYRWTCAEHIPPKGAA